MDSILAGLPQNGRAAIIRLRSLGDCVLTTPALEILKRHRPDLCLAVVVEDRFRALFEGNPDADELLPPNLPALRRWRPALCLNLHGGTRSAWLTAFSGARYRAGFAHFRYRFAYNVRIPRAQEILGIERTVHTAEHLASAMFYLGVPVCEIPRAKLVAATGDPEPAYAVLHPVAATPAKTWRAGGFLAVAGHLKQSGLEPVFIGAAADDLSPFRGFRTVQGAPLVAGNDSGPAHMAAAFGLPVVAIFKASDPAIWGPWRTASQIVTGDPTASQVLDALARLRVHA